MSYVNAPSTKLLATHCAACGRALRDAVSVEAGMGPDCREKYGYGEAQSAPEWPLVMVILDGVVPVSDVNPEVSPRSAANLLVQRAACAPKAARTEFIDALSALGFKKLAEALAAGAGEVVRIEQTPEGRYAVDAPYNPAFTSAVKAARIGARWNPASKTWEIPGDPRAKVGLYKVLREVYSGLLLVGPKGPVRLSSVA